MIQMLMEANETIQNNIGVSEINLMVDLLVSCQQSAIQVGERIEYFEEEGTITVSLLEEYCELVYQLSLALEDAKRAKKITKLLRSLLQKFQIVSPMISQFQKK